MLYRLVRFAFRVLFSMCYTVEVEGKQHIPEGGALLAANHDSYYDPPLIGVALPEETLRFVMLDRLRSNWFYGIFYRRLGTYPVGNFADDKQSLPALFEQLRQGHKVVIFPEGARSSDGNLAPLLPGVFRLAQKAGVPIVPVRIDGTFAVWNRHHRLPKLGGTLVCRFFPPISVNNGKQGIKHAQTDLQGLIQKK